jgi:RNA polymerase sigma factor (sigma-70 family)
MPEADELQLCHAATAGDRDALTDLMGRFGPQVRRSLMGQAPPELQASLDLDDVMQVTYLEAFLRIARFEARGEGAFVAWLTRIAQNNLYDALKELRRAKRPPPERRAGGVNGFESSFALLERAGCVTSTPSRGAAAREVHESVLRAVSRLPHDYQRVVRLYDIDGRAVELVASELGRSVGAVYMLRARALDRLRELLGAESQYLTRKA